MKQNPGIVLKELGTLETEMRMLWQKAEFVDIYHNWIEDFDNLKMEYAFMKA
jgi:hypothetical protein